MIGIFMGVAVFTGVCYLLKLASMHILERRRPDWDEEREQFKRDLARSVNVSKWIFRQYWRR